MFGFMGARMTANGLENKKMSWYQVVLVLQIREQINGFLLTRQVRRKSEQYWFTIVSSSNEVLLF